LILLCLHLFFLTTAVFLRNPKDNEPSVKKVLCHIAEVCVLGGCTVSIFALQAKEIYLQGFNYYVQNLVRKKDLKFKILFFAFHRKVTRKNSSINVHVYLLF
jgi:hypothetical protein